MSAIKIIKKEPVKQFKIVQTVKGLDSFFDTKSRSYINSMDKIKGEHIFDSMDVYFEETISDDIKNASEKGIVELLKAINLNGSMKINYHNFSNNQMNDFLNQLELSKNTDGNVLNNFLSGYGHQKKAYQLLIGNFNMNGLNGSCIGDAVIVDNLRKPYLHQILVAHEMGHLFKAAVNSNRTNTVNLIGLHCFDNKEIYSKGKKIIEKTPYVMRQDFSREHLDALSKVGGI